MKDWKRKLLVSTFSVFFILGCTATPADPVADETETADNVDRTTGTPWLLSSLEGNVTADTPTSLKDDFYLYNNKDDILKTEIPAGQSYGGILSDAAGMLYDDLKNMLVNGQPQSHDEKLVTDLYGLLMDWEGRDAAGVAPLEEMTNHIEGISSIDALTQYFVHSEFNDVMSDLINVGLNANYSDSSRNVIYIDSCSLILEDSAEYSQLTDNGKLKKEAYTELLENMLVKIGYSQEEAVKKIENCLTFEGRLSPAIYTKREMQEPDIIAKINNLYTRNELTASEGIFPLLEQLEERYGIPENVTYMVMGPQYFEKLNTVYTDEYLPEIKDYLIVHTVLGMAQYLDHECYIWNCECQNKINGVSTMLEDDAAYARLTGKLLPWPTARLYSSTYLSETDKQRITTLVNEVIEEYHGIIEEADFLSQATKDKAIEKLDAMGTKILYPDDWTPYSCSELNFVGKEEGGTLLDAINAIAEYENREMIEDSLALNDRSEWLETPLYFNCAYDRNSNNMYIFGCFARGEIYNSEMSDEELYAKMGMIIGHEISHAFDATGAQFDKTGTVANWWTDEDRTAFEQKNAKLAAYFDNIHPWAGQDFKGSIMTGEACADMAGFKCILRIIAKKNFDLDTFFRKYAALWRTKITLQRATKQIAEDVHPMEYLRVNAVLQQYDEFLEFYGIKEGDGMYLAPEDRVNIW